jgi:Leucine-rich repeat (LRR) protein
MAITAITGFQNLPNLNYLRLDGSNNGCETIDVSGCTSLTYLDVSDMDIPGTSTPSLKYLNVEGCTALVNLYMDDSDFSEGFPDLSSTTALQYFDADQCGITEPLDLSALTELRGFDLNGNEGLSSVTISSSQSLGYERSLYLYDCALTQTAVDNMIVALSEGSVENGYVDLSGGTNAAPGALGLAAKATLELSGWTVDVNIE